MRDKQLEQTAAALYSDRLPYHNFRHALDAVESGHLIVRRCKSEHVRIDAAVVYYALLFHDAGYHQDHLHLGFPSKEAYSAELAAQALQDRGIARSTITRVRAAILSTRRSASFRTAEQKAVRAADLAALAADYPVFLDNTRRLWEEYQMLSGQHPSWQQWVEGAMNVIRYYLSQEIRLTSYFTADDGSSEFHRRVRANLDRLRREWHGRPGEPSPDAP